MAKWNCSSGCLKWLFTSESKEKPIRLQKPKKPRKWKCCVSKRSKLREHPTHTAPNRTLSEAIEEQRKHALNVAIATAAAAEAAVAAAHAAAEVVRLTAGVSHSFHYLCKEDRILAAVKIQSAYRRHLARKALRSLKGIVTLQALVRGQAVRSQVSNTLKHMPSNAKNQVEMQDRGKRTADEVKESPKLKGKFEENQTKFECQSQRTGDCSLHSKEDIEGICFRKKEAILRRECMKQFSFFRQEKKTPNKDLGRETCRTLGQWLDEEAEKSGKKKNSQQHLHSQVLLRRKSFSRHGKEISSVGENNSMPNSPAFPSYMAVTESARAKVRSMSAPRQRTEFLDICSN